MPPRPGDSGHEDAFRLPSGTLVGHYEVLAELGRGGMGVVYRARDRTLGRLVALKRPWPRLVSDSSARRRFLREARAGAQVSHAHVVPIFEVLEYDGVPWIAMDLVDGCQLRTRIEAVGPLPLPEILRHAEGLADALDAAHHCRILHRDVNPNNIMITTDGRAMLTDFGLAHVLDQAIGEESTTRSRNSEVSQEGSVLGTPGYMSPEQVLGRPLDARSDIFSLGAVIYEMWTGRRAFAGPSRGAVVDAILHARPPEASRPAGEGSAELQRIMDKALAKSPDERYQTARDLLADLRTLRRHVDHQEYAREHPVPWRRSSRGPHRRLALAGSLLLLALVAASVRWWPQALPPPRAFAERDWLLIAEFENSTGEPIFDETLREGLTVGLNQSRYVNVFPRSRTIEALRRMKREPGIPIDTSLGREICQREDLKVLLAGSIRRSGDAFQIRVQALEPASGRLLFAEDEQFTVKEQLFARVDSLARRVRGRLGESLVRIEKTNRPLDKATTGSLDALQLYSRAEDLRARGDLVKATLLYQGALTIDPGFAMAHLHLGEISDHDGNTTRAKEHYTRAYELRNEVTERERYFIAANYFQSRGEFRRALEDLRVLVSLYPDDREAHHKLALAYDDASDAQGAINELREVLRLNPFDPQAYSNLGLFLVTANAAADAVGVYEEAARKGITSPDFGWGLGLARLSLGDVGRARAEFQHLEAAGPAYEPLGKLHLARTAIYQGQFSDAAEQLDRGILLDQQRGNDVYRVLRQSLRSRVRWFRRDGKGARQDLRSILAMSDEEHAPYLVTGAARLAVEMGDTSTARQVLGRLQRSPHSDSGLPQACIQELEGEILLADGRVLEAIEHFLASLRAYPQYEAQVGLARAYQAQRDWKRAAGAWQRVIEAKGEILRSGYPADWPLAHVELARSFRKLGDVTAARNGYETFLRLWQNADESPLREQVVVESRELGEKRL